MQEASCRPRWMAFGWQNRLRKSIKHWKDKGRLARRIMIFDMPDREERFDIHGENESRGEISESFER